MVNTPLFVERLDLLKRIYTILSLNPSPKHEVITAALGNLATILSINDDSTDFLYGHFCEHNLFTKVANLIHNENKAIKAEVLKTIHITLKNQKNITWLYYILGNKGLGQILEQDEIYQDVELLNWSIAMLKSISFLLNETTIKFFINPIKVKDEFVLFTKTLKLIDSHESMVRTHAKFIILKILNISDTLIDQFILNNTESLYIISDCFFKCFELINSKFDIHSISNLEYIWACFVELEDYITFLNDLFSLKFTQSEHLLHYMKNKCIDKLISIINAPPNQIGSAEDDFDLFESLNKVQLSNSTAASGLPDSNQTNLTSNASLTPKLNSALHHSNVSNTPTSDSSMVSPIVISPIGDKLVPSDESTYRSSGTPEVVKTDNNHTFTPHQFHPLIAAYILIQLSKLINDGKFPNLTSWFKHLRGMDLLIRIRPFISNIFELKFESLDSSLLVLLEFLHLIITEIKKNEIDYVVELLLNIWNIIFDSLPCSDLSATKLRIITIRNLTVLTCHLNIVDDIKSLIPNIKIEEVTQFDHLGIIWDEWHIFKSTYNTHCQIGFQALFLPKYRNYYRVPEGLNGSFENHVDGVRPGEHIPVFYLLPSSPQDIFRYQLQAMFLFELIRNNGELRQHCPLVMDNWSMGFIYSSHLKIAPPGLIDKDDELLKLGDMIDLSDSIICRLINKDDVSYRHFIANDMLFILALKEGDDNKGKITCLNPIWNVSIENLANNPITIVIMSYRSVSKNYKKNKPRHYDRERLTASTGSPSRLRRHTLILDFDTFKDRELFITHISKASNNLVQMCKESVNLYTKDL